MTPTLARLSAACRSAGGIAGFDGGRPVRRSPDAGGLSARMKYSCTGLVMTMAPARVAPCACRSDAEGLGRKTGAAVIVPDVEADHPFG
ncbi:MAG: hypothetical protein R2712_13935 [Vicinamibacterales bacterium]